MFRVTKALIGTTVAVAGGYIAKTAVEERCYTKTPSSHLKVQSSLAEQAVLKDGFSKPAINYYEADKRFDAFQLRAQKQPSMLGSVIGSKPEQATITQLSFFRTVQMRLENDGTKASVSLGVLKK